MQIQSQTSARITITPQDMLAALAQYITANGFEVTPDDFPEHLLPEEDLEILITQDISDMPKPKAKPVAKAPAKAKEEPKQEPKPVAAKAVAETEDDTMVPANEVAAYRAKMEAEKQAKVAEVKPNPFDDDEDELVEATPAASTTTTAKFFEDDEDELEEKVLPAAKTSNPNSIFEDDTEAQTTSSDNLFDD